MTDKLQTIDSIGAVGTPKTETPSDPLQAEYEEGKKYLENGEYGQAAVALHNSLVGFKEKNDEAGVANASNQLGHVCFARGEYESALQHYQQAFKICDKSNDRMSIVAVMKKIVAVYDALKQYDQAIKSALVLLDHYHDNRDPQGSVTTLEEMTKIYLHAGEKEKAADTCRTIASIHKNFRHEKTAAEFLKKAEQLGENS